MDLEIEVRVVVWFGGGFGGGLYFVVLFLLLLFLLLFVILFGLGGDSGRRLLFFEFCESVEFCWGRSWFVLFIFGEF